MSDYTAIVIENWDTGSVRYLALSHLLQIHYVEDADDAVHFTRREDAERLCYHGELHDLRINEHMWPGGEPRKPVVPEDQFPEDPADFMDEARALLETASNLLHSPIPHLRGTVAFEPHKAATAGWIEKYDALNEKLDR